MTVVTDALSASAQYRQRYVRRIMVLAGLLVALVVSVLIDVATGPSGMGLHRLMQVLFDVDSVTRIEAVIVWNVRLPYALMAVLVGAALALAGIEMQTVLANPLASPFTLGISAAAAFGAALAIVLGLGIPGVPVQYVVSANAFVFALISVALLYFLARWRGFGVESLVLFGIALVFVFNALVALLQFVASQDTLQQLVFWTLGSLTRASWERLGILAALLLIVFPSAMRQGWALTAMTRLWHIFYDSPEHLMAVQALAKWIHPELFRDLDPQKTRDEFYARFMPIPQSGVVFTGLTP